jgi:hypothetical protein
MRSPRLPPYHRRSMPPIVQVDDEREMNPVRTAGFFRQATSSGAPRYSAR